MKTLSDALKLEIINQAGATYRSVYLNILSGGSTSSAVAEKEAKVSAEAFINLIAKKLQE